MANTIIPTGWQEARPTTAAVKDVPTESKGGVDYPVYTVQKGNTLFNVAAAVYVLRNGVPEGCEGKPYQDYPRGNFDQIDQLCAEICQLNDIDLGGKLPSELRHETGGGHHATYDKLFHLKEGQDRILLPADVMPALVAADGGTARALAMAADVIEGCPSGDLERCRAEAEAAVEAAATAEGGEPPAGPAPTVDSGGGVPATTEDAKERRGLGRIRLGRGSDADKDPAKPRGAKTAKAAAEPKPDRTKPAGGSGVFADVGDWFKRMGRNPANTTTADPVASEAPITATGDSHAEEPAAAGSKRSRTRRAEAAAAELPPEGAKPERLSRRERDEQAEKELERIAANLDPKDPVDRAVGDYLATVPGNNHQKILQDVGALRDALEAVRGDPTAFTQVLDENGLTNPDMDREVASNAGVLGAMDGVDLTGAALPDTGGLIAPKAPSRPQLTDLDTRHAAAGEPQVATLPDEPYTPRTSAEDRAAIAARGTFPAPESGADAAPKERRPLFGKRERGEEPTAVAAADDTSRPVKRERDGLFGTGLFAKGEKPAKATGPGPARAADVETAKDDSSAPGARAEGRAAAKEQRTREAAERRQEDQAARMSRQAARRGERADRVAERAARPADTAAAGATTPRETTGAAHASGRGRIHDRGGIEHGGPVTTWEGVQGWIDTSLVEGSRVTPAAINEVQAFVDAAKARGDDPQATYETAYHVILPEVNEPAQRGDEKALARVTNRLHRRHDYGIPPDADSASRVATNTPGADRAAERAAARAARQGVNEHIRAERQAVQQHASALRQGLRDGTLDPATLASNDLIPGSDTRVADADAGGDGEARTSGVDDSTNKKK